MAGGGVRSFFVRALLEDERGAIRRYPVELLLLRDEVDLRLRLHRESQLLLRSETVLCSGLHELEGVLLADRRHKAKTLVLVAGGHRWTSLEHHVSVLVWSVLDPIRVLSCALLQVQILNQSVGNRTPSTVVRSTLPTLHITVPIHMPRLRLRRLVMVPKYFIWQAKCTVVSQLVVADVPYNTALAFTGFFGDAFGFRGNFLNFSPSSSVCICMIRF